MTVLNEPSSRSWASAGSEPSSIARPRTSGRAPSARRMMTDKGRSVRDSTRVGEFADDQSSSERRASGAPSPDVDKLIRSARAVRQRLPSTGVKWPNEISDPIAPQIAPTSKQWTRAASTRVAPARAASKRSVGLERRRGRRPTRRYAGGRRAERARGTAGTDGAGPPEGRTDPAVAGPGAAEARARRARSTTRFAVPTPSSPRTRSCCSSRAASTTSRAPTRGACCA